MKLIEIHSRRHYFFMYAYLRYQKRLSLSKFSTFLLAFFLLVNLFVSGYEGFRQRVSVVKDKRFQKTGTTTLKLFSSKRPSL